MIGASLAPPLSLHVMLAYMKFGKAIRATSNNIDLGPAGSTATG